MANLSTIKPRMPAGKTEHFYWDDEVPGFGLRLRAGGWATYVFQYKTGIRHRRISLGVTSATSAEKAREIARQFYLDVKLGGDPQGVRYAIRGKRHEIHKAESEIASATKLLQRIKGAVRERHI